MGVTEHKTMETHQDGNDTSKMIKESLPPASETNSNLAGDPSLCDKAQDHPVVGSVGPLTLHSLVGGALW